MLNCRHKENGKDYLALHIVFQLGELGMTEK